ncbi:DUF5000 domain-containing lipoprotein [Sphingobacterium pedocola]|uniref:F5/8 type C domain-containing protein n=1 Tax=Sphingobacterium pedocola TaxID=2082722 RepID=A0ABR9T816_9SPHI|nr:DUF5000 domain-containing lipoprotein [Sphingobacterium pedocola]MBE8721234.1 hypothetical protein [Sphingobacterium pedocola]
MKRTYYLLLSICLLAVTFGCEKEGRLDHIDPNAPAPQQISNVRVTELPGAAVLKYNTPADPNFSYVKAVYEIQPGVFREGKSSMYIDTLELVGFGDVRTYNVKLYSVGKNEKASDPLVIRITPKSPPVKEVFKDLTLENTFGGIKVSFTNESQAKLSIVVMVDSTGQNTWAPVTTFYTGALEGSFSARGYEPEEKRFAVFVRDRWNNKSDTLIKALTPMFEELIPKPWSALRLPGDTYDYVESFSVEKLWDNNLAQNAGIFATTGTAPIPQWQTIDLGKPVVLSRMKSFQRQGYEYSGAAVRSFEIWGSNNPVPDGSWDSWQLMGTFNSFKPSGQPSPIVTPEDRQYASFAGEDFDFELMPAVRYIRYKTTSTYGSAGQVVIAELSFWGQIVN